MKTVSFGPITNLFSAYAGLSRPVWVLFAAQVVNRAGDFVFPFTALLLTRKLRMDAVRSGTWVMGMMAAMTLGAVLSGKAADHFGRKSVLLFFKGLSGCLIIVCGFLGSHPSLPIILLVSTFFVGAVRPVFGAMINDLCIQEERKKAFSLNYLGINVGAAIGPLAAGFLFEKRIEWFFWADGLTTFFSLLLVMRFVPESKPLCDDFVESPGETAFRGGILRAFFSRSILWRYSAVFILVTFTYAQCHFGLPLLTDSLFGADGPRIFGWLISFNAFCVLAFTGITTKLFLRTTPLLLIAIAAGLYAVGFGMNAFNLPLPFLFLSTFFWTIGEILFATNNGAFIASHTPINMRGRFQSIIHVFSGTGSYMSPSIGGLVVHVFGLSALWTLTGLAGTLAATLYYLLHRYELRLCAQPSGKRKSEA